MSNRRRANGEGSIFEETKGGRKTGRYRISVTRWKDGQRVRKTRIAWKKADAVAILAELRGDATVPTGHLTVSGFLAQWLRDVISGEKAENTHDSYKLAVNNHIASRIGGIRLDRFKPINVQSWLASMARDEVGSRTRENAFAVLKAAFEHAVDLDLIASNPCSRIAKPSHEPEQIQPFTLEQAKELLSETVGQRWHGIFQIALTAGARQGEVFGLCWDRIDWKKRQARIDQQVICISGKTSISKPKTKASIRTIDLTESCCESLRSHRAIMMKEGHAANDLVFPAPEGGLIGRSTFRTRVWVPLLKSLLFEERGFHHTRHTYATLALGAGVPITVVSRQLGHSKVSTTLDIYSHVLDSHQVAATATIARLFG